MKLSASKVETKRTLYLQKSDERHMNSFLRCVNLFSDFHGLKLHKNEINIIFITTCRKQQQKSMYILL